MEAAEGGEVVGPVVAAARPPRDVVEVDVARGGAARDGAAALVSGEDRTADAGRDGARTPGRFPAVDAAQLDRVAPGAFELGGRDLDARAARMLLGAVARRTERDGELVSRPSGTVAGLLGARRLAERAGVLGARRLAERAGFLGGHRARGLVERAARELGD